MAKKKAGKNGNGNGVASATPIGDYRHKQAKRKNNPPAKIAAEGTVPAIPKAQYAYNPHLPPVLRFDPAGSPDKLPKLLEKATREKLTADEARLLADALRHQEPWLEWATKRESQARGFEVDPVALHIHERVAAQAILKVAARQDVERSLFGGEKEAYHEAVQFYRHDIDWTNRLILGDSLQVMSSLAKREDLAGKVQMIYIDPPYGIKFASNFQSEIGKRDVKDKEQDLTREPEMVRAYRDTWQLGVHSYLSYLRDRLVVAKELLADSGSIFVQISDENVHLLREVLDEVFGQEQFCALIPFTKTTGFTPKLLSSVADYLLWYARDRSKVKFRRLFAKKELIESPTERYVCVETAQGQVIDLTYAQKAGQVPRPKGEVVKLRDVCSQGAGENTPVQFNGQTFAPPPNRHWSIRRETIDRFLRSGYAHPIGKSMMWKCPLSVFPYRPIHNIWTDIQAMGFGEEKQYVVQTSSAIVQRCLLMTTDPGDLVLDPTCGSGTTGYVAEQWGRRWITIDTSRVAVSIARQRLLTAKFDYYQIKLNGTANGSPASGFVYKTVPHVTLKSIAQNVALDPIFEKHEPILTDALAQANDALARVSSDVRAKLTAKLLGKQKAEGKKAVTEADRRRWDLPGAGAKWETWSIPFDTDELYPPDLAAAVNAYRAAWRERMDAVNASIAASAEQEELVDQPQVVKGVVRVSGPFTVEAVQPPEMSLGDVLAVGDGQSGEFGGTPDEVGPTFAMRPVVSGVGETAQDVAAYLDKMVKLLRLDGVRFPNNKQMTFTRLEPLFDSGSGRGFHAEGRWVPKGETDPDPDGSATVAVVIGPQYGPVTAAMVEKLIKPASRKYDDLVVAGFSFAPEAQAIFEEGEKPVIRLHIAHIRPDVNPGMDGLLKEQPGSQLFTVFGQPRINVEGPDDDGEFTVSMDGVDVYNPVDNSVTATGADKVAAWFIDGDYDGRTFCVTQAFFPDRSAWEKLAKALGGVVDPDRFEALSGTTSLPFPAGKHKTVAVKVIDPRGNEVMSVHPLA